MLLLYTCATPVHHHCSLTPMNDHVGHCTYADDVCVGVGQPALHAVALVKMPGTNININGKC